MLSGSTDFTDSKSTDVIWQSIWTGLEVRRQLSKLPIIELLKLGSLGFDIILNSSRHAAVVSELQTKLSSDTINHREKAYLAFAYQFDESLTCDDVVLVTESLAKQAQADAKKNDDRPTFNAASYVLAIKDFTSENLKPLVEVQDTSATGFYCFILLKEAGIEFSELESLENVSFLKKGNIADLRKHSSMFMPKLVQAAEKGDALSMILIAKIFCALGQHYDRSAELIRRIIGIDDEIALDNPENPTNLPLAYAFSMLLAAQLSKLKWEHPVAIYHCAMLFFGSKTMASLQMDEILEIKNKLKNMFSFVANRYSPIITDLIAEEDNANEIWLKLRSAFNNHPSANALKAIQESHILKLKKRNNELTTVTSLPNDLTITVLGYEGRWIENFSLFSFNPPAAAIVNTAVAHSKKKHRK